MEHVLIKHDFDFKKAAMELTFLINQFTSDAMGDECPPYFVIEEEILRFKWNDYKIRTNWGNPLQGATFGSNTTL